MKILLATFVIALGCAVLSGCGASPMSVEARTQPANGKRELTIQDRLLMHQQRVNSRGAY